LLGALADRLATVATGRSVEAGGNVAVPLATQTTYVAPAAPGPLELRATRLHGGRTTWVWDVTVSDAAGAEVVIARCTVAIAQA
jgi:uncharacterized protein (TIGR00369 family)